MAKITGSGQRVLAELSQDPVARKNKYDTLKRQFDALERRADYLATRLEANQTRSNQGAYNAIVQQLQDTESRINSLATEMNSIAEASRYRAQEDRRQQKIPDSKPKTVMDSVRESLPYQIASSIPQMAVDAYKGVDKTIQYGVNQAMTGNAGTQGSVMNPEDFYMGDVADTYIKELGKNTGTYLDALNSLGYWGATGRLGSKPDSQDGRFRNMIGDAVPRVFGTKDIVDPTVAKGAEIVADPLALVPVAGRVKAGVDAVTDPKLWQGIARDISMGTRSQMFKPVVPWSTEAREQEIATNGLDWLGGYTPQIQDAYRKFEELSAQGVDPKEIFKQTRIFKNVDGVPYFETDDSLAIIDADGFRNAIAGGKKGLPLSDVLKHPELSASDYAWSPLRGKYVVPQKNRGAGYSPSAGIVETYPDKIIEGAGDIVDEVPINIIHESNHMLSADSNLSNSGSNIAMSVMQLNEYKRNLDEMLEITPKKIKKLTEQESKIIAERQKLIDRMSIRGDAVSMDEYAVLAQQRKDLDKKLASIIKRKRSIEGRNVEETKVPVIDAYNLYQRNNGEALSRMAEARMALDDTARREAFPLDDDYFRKTTGYTPDETWFNKYDINKYRYENDLTFPLDIQQKLIDYLDKGKAPYKPRKGMKKI